MLHKLGALNFVQSEWGTSPTPVFYSTTVIDVKQKGAVGLLDIPFLSE
jgi:hypothetical protein